MSFPKMLEFGKTGESRVSEYFKRSGFSVLPVYEIESEGKGPAVYTSSGNYVAPDMFCFSRRAMFEGERHFFIEAKTKSAFTWHRRTSKWATGISKRHFLDYLKVQENAGFPIWIMFLQLDGVAKDSEKGPDGLYGATLESLWRSINHEYCPDDGCKSRCNMEGKRCGRSSMVYWSEDRLFKFASLEEVMGAGSYQSNPGLQGNLL